MNDSSSAQLRVCLSDLELDRRLAQPLPSPEIEDDGHLEACLRCRQRLRALAQFRTRVQEELPTFDSILNLARGAPGPSRGIWGLLDSRSTRFAAAAAVLGLTVGGVVTSRLDRETESDATRTKGSLRMSFYVKRGDAVIEGKLLQVLHPGDAVQFSVQASRAGYLSILSLDGAGQLSVYYPAGDRAVAFSERDHLLPQSTILDHVLGPEVFVAVHCTSPVEIDWVKQRVLETGPERFAMPGCTSDFIRVEKRAP